MLYSPKPHRNSQTEAYNDLLKAGKNGNKLKPRRHGIGSRIAWSTEDASLDFPLDWWQSLATASNSTGRPAMITYPPKTPGFMMAAGNVQWHCK